MWSFLAGIVLIWLVTVVGVAVTPTPVVEPNLEKAPKEVEYKCSQWGHHSAIHNGTRFPNVYCANPRCPSNVGSMSWDAEPEEDPTEEF
jgi:hypothetical protein